MQNAPEHCGKIIGTHGFKGHVVINHILQNNKELDTWPAIMVSLNANSFIPFFIKEVKHINANEAIILLEEVESVEEAKKINACNIYIAPTVTSKGVAKNEWVEIINYAVYNNQILLGTIINIVENSMQQLFEIESQGKILHIPIQENFIAKLDAKTKSLHVQLPDGYLEIFTQ